MTVICLLVKGWTGFTQWFFKLVSPPNRTTFPLNETLCRCSACKGNNTKPAQAWVQSSPSLLLPHHLSRPPTEHLNPKATPGVSQALGSTA